MKRTATAGERWAMKFWGISLKDLRGDMGMRQDAARDFDRAIRTAVVEAWDAGVYYGHAAFTSDQTEKDKGEAGINKIMEKYGVRL